MFDLAPASTRMSRLVSAVRDDQLADPTPCSDWNVGELLAHIHQFATVFTSNAHKQEPSPPDRLVDDWRRAIPAQLEQLSSAWRAESAWQGRVSAGGVDMAAADNPVVAIEELTVHGWDLARATGGELTVDDAELDQIEKFFELFGAGPFGPPAPEPDSATRLDRTIARTGRDPAWRPAG